MSSPFQSLEKPILKFCFEDLLKQLNRKIKKSSTVHNPWTISVSTKILPALFWKWFKIVRDFRIQNFLSIELKKSRAGITTQIHISFTNIGLLCLHLREILDLEKEDFKKTYFVKEFKYGFIGSVLANDENPATIVFNMKTGIMKLTLKYEVKNEHGVIMY